MSGPPLTYNPATVLGPEAQPGDTREAPGGIATALAGVRVSNDQVIQQQSLRLNEAYEPIVQALQERLGTDRREYLPERSWMFEIGNPLERGGMYDGSKVWEAVQSERRRDPEAFADIPATREEFEQSVLRRQGERDVDQDVLQRGSPVAGFAGGMVGIMSDPVNLLTLPMGGLGNTVLKRILTEGAVNAGIEAAQTPQKFDAFEGLGEKFTLEQAGYDIALAGAGGAAFRGVLETGAAGVQAARRLDPNFEDKQLARAFEDMVPQNLRTPEQEAALSVLRRNTEIEEASPFVRTYEADEVHLARLQVATDALNAGRVPTPGEIAGATLEPGPRSAGRPAARPVIGSREDIKRAIAGPESSGNDAANNAMGSSAAGRYQFIEETFVNLYRQEYRVSAAEAQRAWDSNRYDVGVQERLMDRLLDQNAAALEKAGLPADAGNLYLAHFAGSRRAVELLEADPSRPVSDFFWATEIRQNPTYLGGGKTVGDAIAIIRGKVGDPAQRSPAPVRETPELRDPAIDAARPTQPLAPVRTGEVGGEIAPLIEPLTDIALNTRRSLNQVDALAEDLGQPAEVVRAALDELVERGTLTRNSKSGIYMRKAAAPITPANTPRPRTLIEYLAERGGLNDYGGDLQALGIRLGDRRFGAKIIRNVLNENDEIKVGDGDYGLDSAFQAARDAGYFPEFNGFDEVRYSDLIDKAAVLLEAIEEELGGLPRYSEASWDRLAEHGLKGSTEEIYGGFRRGGEEIEGKSPTEQLQDDFRRAWEEFGNDPADLDPDFLFRAAELYESGEAFLPELALAKAVQEDYEATIARAIEEGLEAEYGARYDPWDPKWQEEVERRLRAQLNGNGAGADGAAGGGSQGQRGAAREGGADGAPDAGGRSDAERPTGPTERQLDEAAAARPRSDHTNLPAEPDPRFAEPDGEGVRATTESLWHDIDAEGANLGARLFPDKQGEQADFAAPTPEQKRAALQAKTEGGIKPKGETRAAGEDGGLFDTRDTTGDLFDLGDGKGERSVAEIRAELDTEKSGLEAMRSCLK